MSRNSDNLREQIVSGTLKLGRRAENRCAEGYLARIKGEKRSTCPLKGTPEAKFWYLGWDNADNDKRTF